MTGNKAGTSLFDIKHNREQTNSVKYNNLPRGKRYRDIIPMWIADMDFKAAPEIEEALAETVKHGIYGYSETDACYDEAVVKWYSDRMGFNLKAEWNVKTPGVIFAVAAAIRAFTNGNDGVLICQPVYYPFEKIVKANRRRLVISRLKLSDGRYIIDFEDFENKIIEQNVKLFILCSPHNPVGRVWSREELLEIGRICVKRNVLIVSDEIHSDFIYKGFKHIPIASLSEEISQRTITCTSPSKTFNLAGLQGANIWVENGNLRRKLKLACAATGIEGLNTMEIAAATAAYKYGGAWFDELMEYLEGNAAVLRNALYGSPISLIEPEGTYLMWLDCRGLNLTDEELKDFFIDDAGLLLHNGATFGDGGSGFMRMNIACPQGVLTEALNRLKKALEKGSFKK